MGFGQSKHLVIISEYTFYEKKEDFFWVINVMPQMLLIKTIFLFSGPIITIK